MAQPTDEDLAAVRHATEAAVAAVHAHDVDRLRAVLTDPGAVDRTLWYSYIVSDLLDLVRLAFDLHSGSGGQKIRQALPEPGDGFWLRSAMAGATGQELSVEEAERMSGVHAAAINTVRALMTEYLRLEVNHGQAQQKRFLELLDQASADPDRYVTIVMMLATAAAR